VAYGVYGEILSQTGTIATPFLFNGRWGVQTDGNGLYHHRARYYHPQLRRFLNQDTVLGDISDSASMNRFAYANGNPVSMVDPFGLMAVDMAANILLNADAWKEGIAAWKESDRYLPMDRVLMRALVVAGLTTVTLDAILNLVSGGSKAAVSGTVKTVTHADDFIKAIKAAENGLAAGTDSISAMRRLSYKPADYHGAVGNAVKSRGPANGQEVLDISSTFSKNSPGRIGVDSANGEIVVFSRESAGVYHGHVRTWGQLTQSMKNTLIETGDYTRRGAWVKPR
jgi:RHS repeat-associated protein